MLHFFPYDIDIFVGRLPDTNNMIWGIGIIGLSHGLELYKQKLTSGHLPHYLPHPTGFESSEAENEMPVMFTTLTKLLVF